MKYVLFFIMGVSFILFFIGVVWGCLARGKKRVRKGQEVAKEVFSERFARDLRRGGGKPIYQKSFVRGSGLAVDIEGKISWNEIILAITQGRVMDIGFVFFIFVGMIGLFLSLACYFVFFA